jgi:4-hydroxy-2-oxoheptanedioate aldolase
MRPNKLRELLNAGKPSIGTRIHSTWPSVVEAIGHTGMFDYVEFLAEYAPFDLYSLDNFCRAVELFDMSAIIKIDQEPRGFLAQRGIGAGFQGVLFADCRTVDEVQQCVAIVRSDTPEDGGIQYVQALRDTVVLIMIEKQAAVDRLEEILAVKGIDMVQWGPVDFSMSIGRPGEKNSPEVKAIERKVLETALKMGVPPRAEIASVDQAKYYLDLGVRHFNIGTDLSILYNWWKTNGDELRKIVSDV